MIREGQLVEEQHVPVPDRQDVGMEGPGIDAARVLLREDRA